MEAEIFAQCLQRQGYRVVHTQSSYWAEIAPRIYQAFPYRSLIDPGSKEISSLFRNSGAIGIRFSTPLESRVGVVSYHVVLDTKTYSLDCLSKKARYDVRKGFAAFHFEPISFERLADEGWRLRCETLERQGRSRAETKEWWHRLCRSAIGLPGFEAWAAMTAEGKLSAALIAFYCEDCCSILYQQSLSSYLADGVNNALTYSYTREVMNRPDIKSIFYGLHSLDAPASVDLFKLRMGYSARPVRQCVLIHPWISPLFNRTSLSAIRQARRLAPGYPLFSKAEGMLRFYIDGKRNLSDQSWPEPIMDQKEVILGGR